MLKVERLTLLVIVVLLAWARVAEPAPVTIRYWSFLDPKDPNPRSVAQTKIIEGFTAKHPDIVVKVEVVHWSKMVRAKAGTTAMLVDGTQVFGAVQAGKDVGKNLRTAPLSSFDPLRPAPAIVAGQTLTISKDSKVPDAAWKFIAHMISPSAQAVNAQVGKNLPVRKSSYDAAWFRQEDAAELLAWKEYILTGGRLLKTTDLSEFMNDSLAGAYEEILTGRAPAKPALERAAARFNERLRQGK